MHVRGKDKLLDILVKNPYIVYVVTNVRPSSNIVFIQETPSAPTVSAVLVLTARCNHAVHRQCMKSDCMGLFPIPQCTYQLMRETRGFLPRVFWPTIL
jgi:hypothetical protein